MPATRLPALGLFHLHVDSDPTLKSLYLLRVLRDLVNKFAFFFLPIFLFEIGIEMPLLDSLAISDMQKGLLVIAGYFFLTRLVLLSTIFISTNATAVFGYSRALAVSYLLRILLLLMFYHVYEYPNLLWVIAIVDGFQLPLFWNSYHTLLSEHAQRNKMGQDLGFVQFFVQLSAAIVPSISGFLAVMYDFKFLFLFAIAGPILGLYFALKIQDRPIRDRVSVTEFIEWIRDPNYLRLGVSFFGKYINDSAIFLWPLYVHFLLGSVDKVGYLYSTSLILALALNFVFGWYIDKKMKLDKRPFFASGWILSVIWFVRLIIIQPIAIAFVDSIDKLISNFHWLTYDSAWLKRGKGSQDLSYFAYRELFLAVAGLIFWGVFGVFVFIGANWTDLFVFASVGVLLTLLVQDRRTIS